MKRVHTTEKSKFIIEKLMIQHFSEIFHKLDSDGDGIISSQKIDLSNLDTSLLGVLEHIFSEMEEMGHQLNEEEFIDALGRLHEALPMPLKKQLFDAKKIQEQRGKGLHHNNSDKNFHRPKLDPNSVKIAAQSRGQNDDITEILYRKKKEYDQRNLQKQQEKENMELVGCTFHPNILQSPQNNSARYNGI